MFEIMDMQMILMAVITILGGTQAWGFYKNYIKVKFAERKEKMKMEMESKKHAHSFSNAERNEIKEMLSSQVDEYKTSLVETREELKKAEVRIKDLEVKYATIRERLLRYTLHSRGGTKKPDGKSTHDDIHDPEL